MSTWTFVNDDRQLIVTRDSKTFTINKESVISVSSSGDIVYFNYSDNNSSLQTLQSANKARNIANVRNWAIDYTDISAPTAASAAEMETLLESWVDKTPDVLLEPVNSDRIPTNTTAHTYGFYSLTGTLSLTIDGNGKFVIH